MKRTVIGLITIVLLLILSIPEIKEESTDEIKPTQSEDRIVYDGILLRGHIKLDNRLED